MAKKLSGSKIGAYAVLLIGLGLTLLGLAFRLESSVAEWQVAALAALSAAALSAGVVLGVYWYDQRGGVSVHLAALAAAVGVAACQGTPAPPPASSLYGSGSWRLADGSEAVYVATFRGAAGHVRAALEDEWQLRAVAAGAVQDGCRWVVLWGSLEHTWGGASSTDLTIAGRLQFQCARTLDQVR